MRRSSFALRRGTDVRSTGSLLRERTHRTTTSADRAMKTIRPSQVLSAAAATMSAKYPIVSRRKRYASASLRNGFPAMG